MTAIPAPQGIHEQTATVDFATPIDVTEVATVFYAYDEQDESWEGAGFFAHLDDALWSTARTFADEVYGADVTPPVPVTWRIHHHLWHLWDGDSPTDIVVSDRPLLGSAPSVPTPPPADAALDEQPQDERDGDTRAVAALTAERDEARELACVSLDILRNVSDEPMRELYGVEDMDEMPAWFTRYGKASKR